MSLEQVLREKLSREDALMEADGLSTLKQLWGICSRLDAEKSKAAKKEIGNTITSGYRGFAEISNFVGLFLACTYGEHPKWLDSTSVVTSLPVESPTVNTIAVKALEKKFEAHLGVEAEEQLKVLQKSWFVNKLFVHKGWRRMMVDIAVRTYTSRERAGEPVKLPLIEVIIPQNMAEAGYHLEAARALHVIEKTGLVVHGKIHRDLVLLCLTSTRVLLDGPEDNIFTLNSVSFLPAVLRYTVDTVSRMTFPFVIFVLLLGRLEKSCCQWKLEDATYKDRMRGLTQICKARMRRLLQEIAFAGLYNQVNFDDPSFGVTYPEAGKLEPKYISSTLSSRMVSLAYCNQYHGRTNPVFVFSELCLDLWREQQEYLRKNTLHSSMSSSGVEDSSAEDSQVQVRDAVLSACKLVRDDAQVNSEMNSVADGLSLNVRWVIDAFGAMTYTDQIQLQQSFSTAAHKTGRNSGLDFRMLDKDLINCVMYEVTENSDPDTYVDLLRQPWIILTLLKRLFTDSDISVEKQASMLPNAYTDSAPEILKACSKLITKIYDLDPENEKYILLYAVMCRNANITSCLPLMARMLEVDKWTFESGVGGNDIGNGNKDYGLVHKELLLGLCHSPFSVTGLLLWMAQHVTSADFLNDVGGMLKSARNILQIVQLIGRMHPTLSIFCWLVASSVLTASALVNLLPHGINTVHQHNLATYAVNAFVPLSTEGRCFSLCVRSLAKWVIPYDEGAVLDHYLLRRFLLDIMQCMQRPYSPHFVHSMLKSVKEVLEGRSLDRNHPEDIDVTKLIEGKYTPGFQARNILSDELAGWVLSLCGEILSAFETLKTNHKETKLAQYTCLNNTKLIAYPGGLPTSSVTVPWSLQTLCEETARVIVRK